MGDLRLPVAGRGLELELLRAVHKLLRAGVKLLRAGVKLLRAGVKLLPELLQADPVGRLAAML